MREGKTSRKVANCKGFFSPLAHLLLLLLLLAVHGKELKRGRSVSKSMWPQITSQIHGLSRKICWQKKPVALGIGPWVAGRSGTFSSWQKKEEEEEEGSQFLKPPFDRLEVLRRGRIQRPPGS